MTLSLQNPFVRHLAGFIASMGVIFGFSAAVLQPHAEDFIRKTTNDQISNVERATANLGTKTDQLRRQVEMNSRDIQHVIQEQKQGQGERQEIKGLIKDQGKLSERILFELSRRSRR